MAKVDPRDLRPASDYFQKLDLTTWLPKRWAVEWRNEFGDGVEVIEAASGGVARLVYQEAHSSNEVTKVRRARKNEDSH